MISAGRAGETISCSMVPRSFSRTIESEVATTAASIISMPVRPGTRNLALLSSALNQMRGSGRITGMAGGSPACSSSASRSCWVVRSAIASR